MIKPDDITAIGKFQKTHALKGELNAILDLEPDFVEEGNPIIVDIDGIYVPFFASGIRSKGSTSFLIRLEGIDSEEDARQFVNKTIYAEKHELAAFLDLDEGELYDNDSLKGYKVIDSASGEEVGIIEDIDDSTQNLLFIVKTVSGDEVFIPAVDEFIDDINDEKKEIMMSLPHGLINLNDKTEKSKNE